MLDINHSELLTCDELSLRIKYDARYIREHLKDSVFIEGIHYIRPFGRRKILFLWEPIEQELIQSTRNQMAVPMAAGGSVRG
ncbi:MAG TPA: hypothetical protein VKA31_08365 [Mariprofundaceae bacterium]|nr:hypothetical protein [Mariprofundaceae bacterium]